MRKKKNICEIYPLSMRALLGSSLQAPDTGEESEPDRAFAFTVSEHNIALHVQHHRLVQLFS